jgi:hypothetical protein
LLELVDALGEQGEAGGRELLAADVDAEAACQVGGVCSPVEDSRSS